MVIKIRMHRQTWTRLHLQTMRSARVSRAHFKARCYPYCQSRPPIVLPLPLHMELHVRVIRCLKFPPAGFNIFDMNSTL